MANQHFSNIWKKCFYCFQASNKAVSIVPQKNWFLVGLVLMRVTWRIIPVSKWLGSPPIYIAMNDHLGPTTLSLGYLRSPWLLPTFEFWDDPPSSSDGQFAGHASLGATCVAGTHGGSWTFRALDFRELVSPWASDKGRLWDFPWYSILNPHPRNHKGGQVGIEL